ncbi:hypothetical protein AV940_02130 [Alteromonas sp. Mac2]|nr:hypothetical protein AV940_02130 [Alteromonas sp. Mac2]
MHVLKSFDMSSLDIISLAKMVLVKFLTIANIRFLPVGIALSHNTDAAIAVFSIKSKQQLCHHNNLNNIRYL